MARTGRLKRKAHAQEDNIELSLSDVERGSLPIRMDYTIENISDDRRHVNREPRTTHAKKVPEKPPPSSNSPSDADYFLDLASIEIDVPQTTGKRNRGDGNTRKKRYVSSVSVSGYILMRRMAVKGFLLSKGHAVEELDTAPRRGPR